MDNEVSTSDEDYATVLSKDLFNAFSSHGKIGELPEDLRGWDVCNNLHDNELELICAANKPYSTLRLINASLSKDKCTAADISERPNSANAGTKPRKKFSSASASNLSIRKSKSSRCIATTTASALLSPHRIGAEAGLRMSPRSRRPASDPPIRYFSKFPMLFHGIKDIEYQFKPHLNHKQHMELYRNSYSYILIRKFRELRASGLTGTKLQTALRLNMCSSASNNNKQHTEGKCRSVSQTPRECACQQPKLCPPSTGKPAVASPPVVYYSENCPSGPVLYSRTPRGQGAPSKGSDAVSSTVNTAPMCGCTSLPKSTMEVNSVIIKSSKQRPFDENEKAYKNKKLVGRSPRPRKAQSADVNEKRKSKVCTPVSSVVGFRKVKSNIIRKMSPPGRVPVVVRRSSPSIRSKRDPGSPIAAGANYLSIAMATHTVTSPYYRSNKETDSSVSMI
ncbi:uncharacterized protein LOC143469864 isoform X3 [Clavelina lepadiformis]|uniref:uncharacterized protein LOC143469864 isoform X3 n=1 Tax=Clavelina lepadiformis TaxID=159417 RepID=UPI00404392BA